MACLKRREEEKVMQVNQQPVTMGASYPQAGSAAGHDVKMTVGMSALPLGADSQPNGSSFADLAGSLDMYSTYATVVDAQQHGVSAPQPSIGAFTGGWSAAASMTNANDCANSKGSSTVSFYMTLSFRRPLSSIV